MQLNEITDIHNRRANIVTVAALAQASLYPLLTWPEDKALLKLSDLPLIQGRRYNVPPHWIIKPIQSRAFTSDSYFREFLTVGRGYYRSFVHHCGLTVVEELEVIYV